MYFDIIYSVHFDLIKLSLMTPN